LFPNPRPSAASSTRYFPPSQILLFLYVFSGLDPAPAHFSPPFLNTLLIRPRIKPIRSFPRTIPQPRHQLEGVCGRTPHATLTGREPPPPLSRSFRAQTVPRFVRSPLFTRFLPPPHPSPSSWLSFPIFLAPNVPPPTRILSVFFASYILSD